MKDPAFLLYTKDFQSGTQDMSCEELGAYFRLLLYQHQNDKIPHDKERLMRITGIFSEQKFDLVWETVGNKFIQTGNHLVNQRLNREVNERAIGKPKKIASATFAGLISKSNLNLKTTQKLKKSFNISDFIYLNNELINDENLIKSNVREWFNKMVNQMVNNLANANGDANANEDINVNEKEKEGSGEKTILVYPFESDSFLTQWNLWKDYKNKEFRFNFKSIQSEQAALTELSNKAKQSEDIAIAIIHQSMANGWKGFFELKTDFENGKQKSTTSTGKKTVSYSDDFQQKIAGKLLSSQLP